MGLAGGGLRKRARIGVSFRISLVSLPSILTIPGRHSAILKLTPILFPSRGGHGINGARGGA